MGFVVDYSHWLFLLAGTAVVILQSLILKRLRDYHSSVYNELGMPNIYVNFSIKKNRWVNVYIIKRKYMVLNDDILNVYGTLFISNLLAAFLFIMLYAFLG